MKGVLTRALLEGPKAVSEQLRLFFQSTHGYRVVLFDTEHQAGSTRL